MKTSTINIGQQPTTATGRGLTTGIEPYSGTWSDVQRFHLLRRTMFGLKQDALTMFAGLSFEQSIQQLLKVDPAPPLPVNDYNTKDLVDPIVPFGSTWIHDHRRDNADLTSARIISLKSWMIESILEQGPTLHAKMIFFWHNHLATQAWEVFWPHLTFQHFSKLRQHAFGNFKTLVKEITLDPHMLLYLNGALNRKESPDENYSRELQELFCIGKGADAQFTEGDVQAAARILTGHSIDWEKGGEYLYRWYWHDETNKQFSSFYGDTMIKGRSGDAGKSEVDDMLDMIFDNNEVAPFVVRKLYRFFIYSDIDAETEENLILPLAQIFRDADYEIKPLLEALFKSAHFFETENRGALIKTPLDFLIGFWQTGGVKMPPQSSTIQKRQIRSSMLWTMSNLGIEMMDPPNVAGYPAYYQFPQFDKSWITTNTITQRALITDSFIYWGFWSEDLLTNIDLPGHIASFSHPEDPIQLVDDLLNLHLAHPPSESVRLRLVATLLSGQQNLAYWTSAWYDYLDSPNDQMKKAIVEVRLKVMFQFLMQVSEYHLT